MLFTLNDIGLQMTWIFEKTLEEYKHVVELCKFWKFIHSIFDLDPITTVLQKPKKT